MGLKVSQPFSRTSKGLRFEDDVLTKAQMLSGTDNQYSDGYLVVDADTHDLYIYKTGATPSTETGKFVKVETGGGDSGEVGETFTTNVTVGGLNAGTTINDTDTITSVLKQILIMYIAPAITCVITPATALYKKGTSVNITKFSATATKNSKPIQSIKFEMNSTELETITVGVENGGTFDYSGTVPAITTNTTFKTTVSDGTETKSASKTVEFVNPFYWGASDSATIDSVIGFTEDLTKKANKTYTYNLANQYITIIYDSSYGQLTSIKDANGFEGISGYDTGTFTENGQTYRYYVSQLKVTDSSAKFTFTF